MLHLFLPLLIIASICGVSIAGDNSPIIINGRDAKPAEFPYQVSIQRPRDPHTFIHVCGGSILTPTWILSAAHCQPLVFNNYRIVAGSVKLDETNPERQEINVARYIVHPGFRRFLDDIALLQLAKPLKFNTFVRPIQLPRSGSVPTGVATATGWGAIDRVVPERPNNLQALDVTILSPSACANYSENYSEKEHICAGPVFDGMCNGDSGGPLVQNGQLIGIVSFGSKVCASGSPSYFAKVSNYIDFIKKYIDN